MSELGQFRFLVPDATMMPELIPSISLNLLAWLLAGYLSTPPLVLSRMVRSIVTSGRSLGDFCSFHHGLNYLLAHVGCANDFGFVVKSQLLRPQAIHEAGIGITVRSGIGYWDRIRTGSDTAADRGLADRRHREAGAFQDDSWTRLHQPTKHASGTQARMQLPASRR